ncbi:MAG: PDZ domain-containing protein [Clostridiales bacterium]|nr:PDZ domain-containing protein [Clostridiales bacterium]
MSKKITIGMAIVLMLLAILLTFQLTYVALNNKYQAELDEITRGQDIFSKLAAVDQLYRSLYIGEIDDDELMDAILRGYVYGTGDKYAYYLNQEQFAEMMADNRGEMQGIGVYVIYQNDAIEIINVMPESPALEAGLEPGDMIVYVGGESVAELGYNTALSRLQGEAGTNASFTVARNGELIDYTITRGYVNEISVMSHVYEADPTIGIIKILSFDLGTPGQFKEACQTLMEGGVTRFVFDVRYNPGGDLTAIVEVLDYLLPEGPIVRIVDAAGKEEVYSSDANAIDLPMCVLINENTASAAELFSSALQDYDKAELVGKTTYGKGTVQTILRLADNTGLGISYRMYNPPFSDNYEGIGVHPDYDVDMDKSLANKNIYKITDEEDTQLQKAIAVLNEIGK